MRLLIIHGPLTPAGQGRVQEAFARQPSAGAKAAEVGGALRPRVRRWPPSSLLSFTPFFQEHFHNVATEPSATLYSHPYRSTNDILECYGTL